MGRAAFQVLVIPFKKVNDEFLYCVFRRSDNSECWQWIAGGGENNETPEQAAIRESFEEAAIVGQTEFYKLDSMTMVPAHYFELDEYNKGTLYVIPEYSFGVYANFQIIISDEHIEYEWVDYKTAMQKLKWDSNKTALWELNQRLLKKQISNDN